MAAMKKMAILRLAPEFLAQLLQLPEGAEIIAAGVDDSRGVLRLMIEGAGYDVNPGDKIPEAPAAVCRSSWAAPATVIDWNLPKAVRAPQVNVVNTGDQASAAAVMDSVLRTVVREHVVKPIIKNMADSGLFDGAFFGMDHGAGDDTTAVGVFASGGIVPNSLYLVGETSHDLRLPTAEEMQPAVRSVVQSVADNLLKLPVREMSEPAKFGVLKAAADASYLGLTRTAFDDERPNGRP